jgi:CDP-4-dehydro-6-deoxyglucose reductase, E1
MQAAIGVEQLKRLPEFIEKRKSDFKQLYSRLKKHEKYLLLLHSIDGSEPSWFGFPITIKKGASFTRDDLVKYL